MPASASDQRAAEFLDIAPIARMSGTVHLPGSKSISNRSLLLAALARGTTRLTGLLEADDVDRMRESLRTLGVRIEDAAAGGSAAVHGVAGAFPARRANLFLGNAGTAFRPLTAALALSHGDYELSGAPRMHERPIGDLVDALRALGADIRYNGAAGFPPLTIAPGAVRGGGTAAIRGNVSSQFVTALLMALPLAGGGTAVEVQGELISRPYVDMTLALMQRFGVSVVRERDDRFRVPAAAAYVSPGTLAVEGDASSASYFLAAGAIGGGPVRIEGVGHSSIQGDVGFAATLSAMGAEVRSGDDRIEVRGGGKLHGIDADFNAIPDAAMTAAIVALFAEGPTLLRNIGSWRVKETDRIAAMARELRKLGATVDEGADWMRVTPPVRWQPATIDTYDDHRIAMCFALAALGGVPVRINDPQCVRKTFPGYFAAFERLAQRP
ncbi:MAG TPA: 3-phosphoshikimate 1-carboxyvinyltransferase [Casimicrobiaceae bacterium]|nr:3-phosphoshikimate 1-carboxyvinyltransferase [Casimicrobiaceae bacterium]